MDAKTLQSLINQSEMYLRVNSQGITQEESLREGPGGANTFNWLVGHMAFWRNAMLGMAGLEPVWAPDEGIPYRGHPGESIPVDFDPTDALELGALLTDFGAMHQRLSRWASTEGDIEVPENLLNLLLHEAYHAGQLGILRRSLGKAGAT